MNDLIFSIFPNENFVDLGLIQFGREACAPSKSFGPAARNHFLFHYVLSGKGSLMADDRRGQSRTYAVKGTQGFLLCPGQVSTYIADHDSPWEYAWVEFDGLRVRSMLSSIALTEDSPIYRARTPELRERMCGELLYITQNVGASPFHLIGHLYLFFDYLIRSATSVKVENSNKVRDFYIHEAIEYIQHNFQNNISVEELAQTCGLNRSYFGKIFKEVLGKTPQEFLISFRMAKAEELLRRTQLPVAGIGAAVGYENAMHFSRAFKSVYGISPQKWRRQNRPEEPEI